MAIKGASITNAFAFDTMRHEGSNRGLSREEIFTVLSNDRRRYALHYLKRRGGETVPLRDIVDSVAAWENGVSVDELDSNTRKCVYTALRQSHLPRLDDAGVIDYDHLRGEAKLTDAAKSVELYLEYVPENDIPWHQYYLGLSVIAVILLLLRALDVFPFTLLTWDILAGLIIVMFAVSSIVHVIQSQSMHVDRMDLKNGEP